LIDQERAPVLSELDLGWEELLDPLLDMRFDPRSAHRFLEMLASIQPAEMLDRELVRRLWDHSSAAGSDRQFDATGV
jgi:hypothetical protein